MTLAGGADFLRCSRSFSIMAKTLLPLYKKKCKPVPAQNDIHGA